MAKLERNYQPKVIKKITERLPDSEIFKGDTRYKQGSPDLIVLNGRCWATLEVKKNDSATRQPNQKYYINKLNDMSYAAFIHPDNEEDTLDELQRTLQDQRCSFVPEPVQHELDQVQRRETD